MKAGDILRQSEEVALQNGQFVSHVAGKTLKVTGNRNRKTLGASFFITIIILLIVVIFGSGNLMPTAISERLIEETDVQYADAVESKKIVFQQALLDGNIPTNTAEMLKKKNVLVGYLDENEFVETNTHEGGLVLKIGERIVTAENFIKEVSSNVELYDAFTAATYGRAAYYYDDVAKKTFNQIGTSRHNYREGDSFEETMEKAMGSGNNISVNSVSEVEKKRVDERTGKEETYYEYEETGEVVKSEDAHSFIVGTVSKSAGGNESDSIINSASALNTADTVAKEQRSSLFYLLFMENISMMKAGEGNKSKINEAMNYLYESQTIEMVDVNTGEIIEVTGTPMDSPSLYAILSGNKVNAETINNYASDRILKTIGNQMGENDLTPSSEIVASTRGKITGSIGRFSGGNVVTDANKFAAVETTINSSLVENSFSTIKGVGAGELLVEGAVNVGKALAKGSGAAAGDATAATSYARLNNTVLAMDAKVDRKNRSPFDITSRNTFLGSIVYKFAVANRNSGIMSGLKQFSQVTSNSLVSLLPGAYAEATESYLTSFGDCRTMNTIGAVGSVQCAEVATFDTSTLDDPFNDAGFIQFVEQNTELNNGVRSVKEGSALSRYIIYNDERTTPLGVTDGGILESLDDRSSVITFASGFLRMIKTFLGSSESDKRIASGAAFVNSSTNADWQTYKYAQRYVSLARATAALRQYSDDSTAYNNIRFFEGYENPVVAFLQNYYAAK